MDSFLFTFANQSTNPLPNLTREDDKIYEYLDSGFRKGYYRIIRQSHATINSVGKSLLDEKSTLTLFHFSGHATQGELQFTDLNSLVPGLADLLKECKELKLIFLNGCTTGPLLEECIRLNLNAAIIATPEKVSDLTAAEFSINFYRNMASSQPILLALLESLQLMKTSNNISMMEVTRGLDVGNSINANQWYYYFPNRDSAYWTLPNGIASAVLENPPTYEPNNFLRGNLIRVLTKLDEKNRYKISSEQERRRNSTSKRDLIIWQNTFILERLPFLIAEPLRRLFTNDNPTNRELKGRLVEYVSLFDSTIDLTICTLLAQIYEYLNLVLFNKNNPTFPDHILTNDDLDTITKLIHNGWVSNNEEILIDIIRDLRQIVQRITTTFSQRSSFFVDELTHLIDRFNAPKNEGIYDIQTDISFFIWLKKELPNLLYEESPATIAGLCQVGEKKLSNLFEECSFWTKYHLEAYRTIRVIKFFRKNAKYQHEWAKLMTQYTQDDQGYYPKEDFIASDCFSVVLVKPQSVDTTKLDAPTSETPTSQTKFLNLTPFIIDRNGFMKSNNGEFDLHILDSVTSEKYNYRRIGAKEIESIPRSVKKEEYDPFISANADYTILREQFDEIWQTLSELRS